MKCNVLDYTAKGFWASDGKSHQPWFQKNVNTKVQETLDIRKNQNNLKLCTVVTLLRATQQPRREESSRQEVAQVGRMVLLM